MKKFLTTAITVLFMLPLLAQNKKTPNYSIPFTPDKWDFQPGTAEFVDYKGRKAMKINSGNAVLKNTVFKDGTIEYDVEATGGHLFGFRRKDNQEQESFYFRLQRAGDKLANDGIQYAPFINGVLLWDMYPAYQGPTPYRKGEWNHVKIVVSGKQMRLYVNNGAEPVLSIPALDANTTEGTIAFQETSYVSNLEIKPNVTENLSPEAGVDLTRHDMSYIRKWSYAPPSPLDENAEANLPMKPKAEAFTDSISAERLGLVNLTRKLGGNEQRRVVWLKAKITTDKPVSTILKLGISDEAWVYLNNQMVGVGKNLYRQTPMRMYPNGRISIDNARMPIKLVQGDNELLIAVTNDFYGWGLIAQLESMDGVIKLP
ncbi:MAG TPA: hypothetical protein VFE50_00100 [Cyclobacteriaceae bacterium]|nr:hypothetical protein [Cyclobacteriaceae bacterium]